MKSLKYDMTLAFMTKMQPLCLPAQTLHMIGLCGTPLRRGVWKNTSSEHQLAVSVLGEGEVIFFSGIVAVKLPVGS